jgi:hypothetical protein
MNEDTASEKTPMQWHKTGSFNQDTLRVPLLDVLGQAVLFYDYENAYVTK